MNSRAVVTGIALLTLASSGLWADEAEDRAVQVIQKYGGKFTRDNKADGKPVVVADLSDTRISDAGLN